MNYIFKSSVIVEGEPFHCFETADSLNETVSDVDLAEYNSNNSVKSITMRVIFENNKYYCITTVEIDDVIKSKEVGELKDYILGQFSDGWGEGFEQKPFTFTKDGEPMFASFWKANLDMRLIN